MITALLLASIISTAPVPICHRYRDAAGAWRLSLITIDSAYLQTHLRHGDRVPVSDGSGGLTCGGAA